MTQPDPGRFHDIPDATQDAIGDTPTGRSHLVQALEQLTPASVRSGLLTLRLNLPASPEQVFAHLVEPSLLLQWSPVVPDRRLDALGPATSQESATAPRVDASVLEIVAPWRLVHQWGSDKLIWQLAPDAEQCQLQLVHVLSDRTTYPQLAAGWHICLTVLRLQLAGVSLDRVVGQDAVALGWERLRDRYRDSIVPNDADD